MWCDNDDNDNDADGWWWQRSILITTIWLGGEEIIRGSGGGDILWMATSKWEIKFYASRQYAARFDKLAWMVAAWFIVNISKMNETNSKISSHTTAYRNSYQRYHPESCGLCASSHSTINSICEDLITIIIIVIEFTPEVIICSKLACIWVRAACMHSFHMPCNQLWLATNFLFAFSF